MVIQTSARIVGKEAMPKIPNQRNKKPDGILKEAPQHLKLNVWIRMLKKLARAATVEEKLLQGI